MFTMHYPQADPTRLGFDPGEWGPASHDPANPFSVEATSTMLEEIDRFGERPDDN